MKLLIDDKHYKIVMDILGKYPYSFYAFGSRSKGNARALSDLDLCIIEAVSGNILTHIEEDFEESDLPFKVDIVQFSKLSESFHDLVKKDMLCLQKQ